MLTASSAFTSPTGARADARLVRIGCCPATASRTSRDSSARSNVRGGTGYYDLEIFSDNGTFGNALARLAVGRARRRSWHVGEGGVRARVGGTKPDAA